jgi:hypothetical protein
MYVVVANQKASLAANQVAKAASLAANPVVITLV